MRLHTSRLCHFIQHSIGQPVAGAEVGVWRGDNACGLLTKFPDLRLALVDPYTPYHGSRRMNMTLAEAKAEAEMRLLPFEDRCRWLVMTSREAAKLIPDASLCFAFLDANHRSKWVAEDIEIWIKKIRPGGELFGHDYGGGHPGVKAAVDRLLGPTVRVHVRSRVWAYHVE